MPNTRVMLWVALAAILYLNYEAWMQDYRGPAPAAAASSAVSPSRPGCTGRLRIHSPIRYPRRGAPPRRPPPPSAAARRRRRPPPRRAASAVPRATLHVVTDVLDVTINLKGGEIDRADLLAISAAQGHTRTSRCGSRTATRTRCICCRAASSAARAKPRADASGDVDCGPDGVRAAAGRGRVAGADDLDRRAGLTVTKTFVFTRGWYAIDLKYEVHNDGAAARSLASYAQVLRHWEHASRSYFDVETYSFKGPDVFDGTKTRDLKVESEADSKFAETITNGWLASLQHHFVSAIVPPAESALPTISCRSRATSTC